MKHGDAVLLDPLVQAGCTLDGQGMHGQAVRGQFHDLFDGALYIRLQFSRQSQDQIHIDIIKSKLTCEVEDLFYIFYRMLSSDKIQCLLLHCLWVDRDAGYRIFADYLKFFLCDTVWSSGFNCKLKHMF